MVRKLLTSLQKGEGTGQALGQYILKSLKYAGFVSEEEKVGKTITYSLTPRGTKAFQIAKRRFTKTFLGVL
jgi:DNA-binding PadR family transcriptional regulator